MRSALLRSDVLGQWGVPPVRHAEHTVAAIAVVALLMAIAGEAFEDAVV